MTIIPSYITVKPDLTLERAIAADIGGMDEKDMTESFLGQMSVQYPGPKHAKRKLVVEDPSQEGQDFIADDTEKNKKLQND